MTDYAKELFEVLKKDKATLRKVILNIPTQDKEFIFYFKPWTAIDKENCMEQARKVEVIKEEGHEDVKRIYIDENKYIASIIYFMALDENGKRIFDNFKQIESLLEYLSWSNLSFLATEMGADVSTSIKAIYNG